MVILGYPQCFFFFHFFCLLGILFLSNNLLVDAEPQRKKHYYMKTDE